MARGSRSVILFVFASCCVTPAVLRSAEEQDAERLDHLLKAARHLEQAGLVQRAGEIRALAAEIPAESRRRLLERKQEDARQLEAEIALLRQLSANAGPRVVLSLRVLEFRPARLREKGIPLIGLEQFVRGDGPAAVVDDNGTLVSFLELLEKQNLLTVLCEPKLVATNGHRAALNIDAAGQPVRPDAEAKDDPAAPAEGLAFRCQPEFRDGGKLRLHVLLQSQTPPRTDGTAATPTGSANRGTVEPMACIELTSGQRAILGSVSRTAGDAEVARLAILKAEVIRAPPAAERR